jgi:hypothetical protein
LRILSQLSVGIEIDFINAGLSCGARLGMPWARAQLHSAEFLHRRATPYTLAFWGQRLSTITASSKLVAKDVQAA